MRGKKGREKRGRKKGKKEKGTTEILGGRGGVGGGIPRNGKRARRVCREDGGN